MSQTLNLQLDPHQGFWRFYDLGEDLRYERRRISIESVSLKFPNQVKPFDPSLVERLRHHYQVLGQELSPIVVSEEMVSDPRFDEPQRLFVIQDGHHRFRALRSLYEEDPGGPFKEIEVIVVSALNPNSRWAVYLSGLLLNIERREVSGLERVLSFFHYLRSCVQQGSTVEDLFYWCLQLRQNLVLAKSKMEQRYPDFLENLRCISPGDNDFAGLNVWRAWFLQHYPEHLELVPHLEILLSPLGRAVLVWLEPIAQDPTGWLDSLQAVHKQLGHKLFVATIDTRAPHPVVRALTQLLKTDISQETLIELLYQPDGFTSILAMEKEMPRPATTSGPQPPALVLNRAGEVRRNFRQLNRAVESAFKRLKARDLKRPELAELLVRYHETASALYRLLNGLESQEEKRPRAVSLPASAPQAPATPPVPAAAPAVAAPLAPSSVPAAEPEAPTAPPATPPVPAAEPLPSPPTPLSAAADPLEDIWGLESFMEGEEEVPSAPGRQGKLSQDLPAYDDRELIAALEAVLESGDLDTED